MRATTRPPDISARRSPRPRARTGPVGQETHTYKPGRASGLIAGAFGEVSTQVCDLTGGHVACKLSAEFLALFDIARNWRKVYS